MVPQQSADTKKKPWSLIGASAAIASLCCLTPLVLVMLGLSTAAFAGSLADTLYGSYKWVFRSAGLVFLAGALMLYYRKRGVCTLKQAQRRRNEILNTVLLALIIGTILYVFFLYVIVHYVGVWYDIWPDYGN